MATAPRETTNTEFVDSSHLNAWQLQLFGAELQRLAIFMDSLWQDVSYSLTIWPSPEYAPFSSFPSWSILFTSQTAHRGHVCATSHLSKCSVHYQLILCDNCDQTGINIFIPVWHLWLNWYKYLYIPRAEITLSFWKRLALSSSMNWLDI